MQFSINLPWGGSHTFSFGLEGEDGIFKQVGDGIFGEAEDIFDGVAGHIFDGFTDIFG